MDYSLEDALPKVYVEQKGKLYNLHWDTQDVEADRILDEEIRYIEGFLDGCIELLVLGGQSLPKGNYGHRSGYVPGLTEEVATTLRLMVTKVLHELVTERYMALKKRS